MVFRSGPGTGQICETNGIKVHVWQARFVELDAVLEPGGWTR